MRARRSTWADLIAPAIRQADEGYVLDASLPTTIAEGRRYFAKYSAAARIYLPEGRVPRAGDRFVNKDYAATLRAIATEGALGVLPRQHRAADRRRHVAERRADHPR